MRNTKVEEREPFVYWHWQNLNDRKGGKPQGSGLVHGRCWWHFRNRRTIEFDWNLWSTFCQIGFDIDDEDLTLGIAFPPVALWLSFSTHWWLVKNFAPRKPLGKEYPGVIVIDERECRVAIHNGKLWINPWSKRNETVMADPWWVRGKSFQLDPFELRHMRHEVRRADGTWEPYVGIWERGKTPDQRELMTFPYRYTLKNGTIQDRTATVYVERRAWRPLCLKWTSLFEKERISIDVEFSDEVGERTGTWKGGTVGCGYEMLPGETPEQCLRRMERERKF